MTTIRANPSRQPGLREMRDLATPQCFSILSDFLNPMHGTISGSEDAWALADL